MKIICWLKTLFGSLLRPGFYQDGIPISGHNWVDKEEFESRGIKTTASECKTCGEVTSRWIKVSN